MGETFRLVVGWHDAETVVGMVVVARVVVCADGQLSVVG